MLVKPSFTWHVFDFTLTSAPELKFVGESGELGHLDLNGLVEVRVIDRVGKDSDGKVKSTEAFLQLEHDDGGTRSIRCHLWLYDSVPLGTCSYMDARPQMCCA